MKQTFTFSVLALMFLMPSVLGLDFSDAQAVSLNYNTCDASIGVFAGGIELLTNETSLCEYECDPQVNQLVLNGWCYSNGSVINCNASAPAGTGVNSDYWNVSGINTSELLTNASNGMTAYGWGNHAIAGYITDGNTGWNNIYGFVNSTNHTHSQYYLATNPAGYITDGNTGWNNIYGLIDDGNTNWNNIYGFVNATNGSYAKPGDCPTGYAVMNTTTSGVECVALVPASQTFNASVIATSPGSAVGTVANINSYDSSTYNISEAAGGFITEINFTGITTFDNILMREKYSGGSGHEVIVELWDYDTSGWEEYYEITDQGSFVVSQIPVFDPSSHIQAGLVQARFFHHAPGIGTHKLYIDYFVLNKGTSTLTNSEHDSLSGRENIATNHPDQNINNTAQQAQINSKVNGSGTINTISMFTEAQEIGNSMLTQDVSGVYIDGGYTGQGITLYANGSLWLYDDIFIKGDVLSVTTTSINGTILPSVDSLYDIGANSLRWVNIYSDEIHVGNYNDDSSNKFIYFWEDASEQGESLQWQDSGDKFEFSDALKVTGWILGESLYTDGSGEDLWLGAASIGSAPIKMYANGTGVITSGTFTSTLWDYSDNSNFFDGGCTANQTVTGIDQTGSITCVAIDILNGNPILTLTNITSEIGNWTNDKTSYAVLASPTFTGKVTIPSLAGTEINSTNLTMSGKIQSSSYYNSTLTHGSGSTFVTMMDFGNVSFVTNGTHFCMKGASTVCIET